MTCVDLHRAGTVVLLPGQPDVSGNRRGLSNCLVWTNNMLHFRDGPAGNRIVGFRDFHGIRQDFIPFGVTLTALERAPGWFKVDYHGTQGWISADYVVASGDCAQD